MPKASRQDRPCLEAKRAGYFLHVSPFLERIDNKTPVARLVLKEERRYLWKRLKDSHHGTARIPPAAIFHIFLSYLAFLFESSYCAGTVHLFLDQRSKRWLTPTKSSLLPRSKMKVNRALRSGGQVFVKLHGPP